jgi:hypothetical protein
VLAAAGAAALIMLGCSACRDNLADPVTGDSGGAQATTELDGIQSTLNGIESDMSGDATP